jgi:hypothetical protein
VKLTSTISVQLLENEACLIMDLEREIDQRLRKDAPWSQSYGLHFSLIGLEDSVSANSGETER